MRTAGYVLFSLFCFLLAALLCAATLAMQFNPRTPEVSGRDLAKEFTQFLAVEVPWHDAYRVGMTVTGLAIGLGLAVAGVGLYRMAKWGRNLALVMIVLAGIAIAVEIYCQENYFDPAYDKFNREWRH